MNEDPYRLATPSAVARLLSENRIRPSHRLGQHFLTDPNMLRKIVKAADLSERDTVLEVGAGLGALTAVLVEKCGRVYAVEQDRGLFEVLSRELAYAGNLVLVHGDAARMDLAGLFNGRPPEGVKMVSNLPYNIAATLLVDCLVERPWMTSYTVMIQREVADRLLAEPGGRDYSAATVKVRCRATVSKVASVSRHCFVPPPGVDSTVVAMRRFSPGEGPQPPPDPWFDAVVTSAFAQRRKKLANAVAAGGLGVSPGEVREALTSLGLDPESRPERVSPELFAALARLLRRDIG
ncbi:MAG: ribosomal RNA small subunit methyltransferase A [Actinobacteria bacterium]|nr:ribosomal RNA small subunit methyltransferase A [Actinomycetota bacterium]MBU1944164.1 ribosomal RNA small subunit methyltransferase A [Actinomycetota bacterium]MBU2687483.1 ribosomal RNA small subunit methyltransferase A [Actinomycetota bacterium]